MKKLTLAIATVAALGLSTVAIAHGNKGGFYAGANIGHSTNDFLDNAVTSGFTADKSGLAWNIHGGYMFNQYIGAELGFTKFNDVKLAGDGFDDRFKTHAITIAAKGVYHFTHQASVYAKAGVALNYGPDHVAYSTTVQNGSDNNVAPLVGLGFGYDITNNLTLNAGWTADYGGKPDANYFSDDAATTNTTGNINFFYGGVDYHF